MFKSSFSSYNLPCLVGNVMFHGTADILISFGFLKYRLKEAHVHGTATVLWDPKVSNLQ